MKTINNYRIKNKNILLRLDLNVPVLEGQILDKSRITVAKNTIKKLIVDKNKVFLLSHFGRPKGKRIKKLSLEFLCPILAEELNIDTVYFLDNLDAKKINEKKEAMNFGDVCLLENVRFYIEEEKNNLNFAEKLSKAFDAYVNDAFSASHREHASIVGITKFLPSIAGGHLLKEIKNLNLFLNNSKKPNTAIIGGSKISTKIKLIDNLIEYFDNIIIGGAMANTFLLAKGLDVGKSLVEKNFISLANEMISKCKNYKCNLILPTDVVCANSLKDKNSIRYCKVENVLPDQMILDIGSKSIHTIDSILSKSSMILWNGPLGAFECEPFNHATIEIANSIKKNSKILNISTLAGGGDTVSAIKMAKAEKSFTYISTAGGAFLEWLEGKESPGIKALKKNLIS